VGSGSGYWDNTPHIAAWKAEEYSFNYFTGRYQNAIGQTVDFNLVYQNVIIPNALYHREYVTPIITVTDGNSYNVGEGRWVWRPGGDYSQIISSAEGGRGGTQNEGGSAFSWSGTIAVGPVGFTIEAGVVGDNNNGTNTFFTVGLVHGWEASFQFNYYKISGDFRAGGWSGRGIYGDVGYGWFSIGKSANRDFDCGFEYFPVSYTATKYGYGPCIGFTSFGRTTTTLGSSDIINYIPMYPPTPW
jgi:hypothetical protein